MKRITLAFAITLSCFWTSHVVAANATDVVIKSINIGGNNIHGAYLTFDNGTFSGCTSTKTAIILATDPNYNVIMAAALSAKLTSSTVTVGYGVCEGNYALIRELVLN